MIILANNACTHESRRNRIQPLEISREEQRKQRISSFFGPSLPPDPSLPDARPHSERFRCGGRESNFLAVDFLQFLIALSEKLRVEVAEKDYAKFTTLEGMMHYLAARVH